MRPATSLSASLARDAGGHLFGVFWGSLVVVDLAAGFHLPRAVAFAGVLVVVGLGSWQQGRPIVLAAAGMGWLFVNGFLVNHLGVLRWDGLGDLWRLLACIAVAWVFGRPGDIDAFLTRAVRPRLSAGVRSDGAPAHRTGSAEQEEHALGR